MVDVTLLSERVQEKIFLAEYIYLISNFIFKRTRIKDIFVKHTTSLDGVSVSISYNSEYILKNLKIENANEYVAVQIDNNGDAHHTEGPKFNEILNNINNISYENSK